MPIELTPRLLRTWSMLGQRGTFGAVLTELAKDDPSLVALSADLCNTSGLDRFQAAFPNRFFNTGIAEQGMVAAAAGLADGGYIPFATSFSNFLALRSNEFIRHFLGYMHCNVKLVGFCGGFSIELFGNTHYGMEDISAIRGISGLTILSPADVYDVYHCVQYAASCKEPVYLRLTGKANQPLLHKGDEPFSPLACEALQEGSDVAILATGCVAYEAVKAAALLEAEGISCTVANVHALKPFDADFVRRQAENKKLIVTVEEHRTAGGLGSIVAEILSETPKAPPLLRIGIPEGYPAPGEYSYLLEVAGLTSPQIYQAIKNKLDQQKGELSL